VIGPGLEIGMSGSKDLHTVTTKETTTIADLDVKC